MAPQDYGPTIIGVLITELVLGVAPIIPRLYVRIKLKRAFGWDDALIVLAWILGAVYSLCYIASVEYGYGLRTYSLASASENKVALLHNVGTTFIFFSYAAGKASVAAFLMRIFPQRRVHWALWFVIVTSVTSLVVVALVNLLHCTPIDKAWNPEIEGTCWSTDTFTDVLTYGGALACVYDWILALMPLPLVLRLQMPLKDKCIISAIMCMGVFAGVASLLRTIKIMSLRHAADYSYDTVQLSIWAATEVCVVSIAACLPTLHPLFSTSSPSSTTTTTTDSDPTQHKTLRALNALDMKRRREKRTPSTTSKRQWHSTIDSVHRSVANTEDLELAQKEMVRALSVDDGDKISNYFPPSARIGPTTPFPDTDSEMSLCYELASGGEKQKPNGWFFKEDDGL